MRFLFWWRRRRPRFHAINEAEAYARSYGERSEEIVAVEKVATPPPAPAPPAPPPLAPDPPAPAPLAPDPPAPTAAEPQLRPAGSRLTDAALRSAFLSRLAARSDRHT
jgi:hypothetical protein